MTACGKLFKFLDGLLEEKKTIDQMGDEICDMVKNPRKKIIRLITQHKGEDYLKENAEWLKYDLESIPKKTGHGLGGRKCDSGRDVEKNVHVEDPTQESTQEAIVSPPETPKPDSLDEFIVQNEAEKKPPTPEEAEQERRFPSACSCTIYVPDTEEISRCPCGCGYGYCDINEKWYTKTQIKALAKAEQAAAKKRS